jgi:hypothetical protein
MTEAGIVMRRGCGRWIAEGQERPFGFRLGATLAAVD